MIQRLILAVLVMLFSIGSGYAVERTYKRVYSQNGLLSAEGWLVGTTKMGYWKFYHKNGTVAQKGAYKDGKRDGYWFFFRDNKTPLKEGHYKEGNAVGWWIYNDYKLGHTEKCQYKRNQKQGYCFFYRNKKLFRAEKYESGEKINEWTNLASFIADNPNPKF